MAGTDSPFGPCSIGRAAYVLGDRWNLLIMRNAMLGLTRFEQFRSSLGIADNILSNRLGRLVDAGLLVKIPYSGVSRTPQHYAITAAGVELRPVLQALAEWGHKYVNPHSATTPVDVVHIPCGQVSADGLFCQTCHIAMSQGDIAWVMPWLSPEPVPLATATTGAA